MWSVFILSVPLLIFLLFTKDILLLLGQQPMLAAGAGRFVGMLCWGLPFSLGFQVLRNFSTALSRPTAPLIVMAVCVLFNAFGDYALIFGHFGAPRLELVGSGIASASSYAFSFLTMLVVIWLTPSLREVRIFHRFHFPHWEKLVEVFKLGMPIGLTMIFEAMLFNSATLIMGTFGTASVAAHQIAMMIPSITFMVPLGIGMAATVRVGLGAGARDAEAAQRAGYVAITIGAGFMALTGIFIWIFPVEIASIWFANPSANMDVIVLAAALPSRRRRVSGGRRIAGGRSAQSARAQGCARADVDRSRKLLARRIPRLHPVRVRVAHERLRHLDRPRLRSVRRRGRDARAIPVSVEVEVTTVSCTLDSLSANSIPSRDAGRACSMPRSGSGTLAC